MADAFRKHLIKKQKFVSANAKSLTRRVNLDGLNLHALLFFARKLSKKDTAPVTVLMTIENYSHEDFMAWELPPKYYRWSESLNCMEIAVCRHLEKGETPTEDELKLDKAEEEGLSPEEKTKKKQEKRDAWYYPPENELVFVPLPPGTNLEYSAFRGTVGADAEDKIVRLINLKPKYKNTEQREKYPDMPPYQWNIGSMRLDVGKFDHRVVPSIMTSLPVSLFHLKNPKHADQSQRFVLLKTVDQFDASLEKELSNKVFTLTSLIFSGDDDCWAWENKEALEQKKPFVPLPPDAASTAKKRNSKCMRLFAVIEQKANPDNPRIESISAKLAFWEDMVEQMFQIRDVTLWFKVMRYVATLMAPMFLLATVRKKGTEESEWNLNDGDREEVGEVVELDADGAGPDANGASGAKKPTADEPEDEEAAFARMVAAKENQLQKEQAVTVEHEKIDFYLDLGVRKALVDTYQAIRKFGIPVTAQWLKLPVTNPDGTKEAKDYIAATNLKTGIAIDFKRPSSIPEVVCVSEHFSLDNLAVMNDLVAKGHGEYRAFVNSPTYVNDAMARSFVQAIRTLNAEEGSLLLDGKPILRKNDKGETVPFNISWTKPEKAAYVIYFLNHQARNTAGLKEAEEYGKALIDQYLKPRPIGHRAPSEAHDANGAQAAAASSSNGVTTVANAVATLNAQNAAGAAANNVVVQTDKDPAPGVAMNVDPAPAAQASTAPAASPNAPSVTSSERHKKRLQDEERAAASGSDAEGGDKDKKRKKRRDDDDSKKHKKGHGK